MQVVEDDGLNFFVDTVNAERIRDDEDYEGVRVVMQARLGVSRIPFQIDIGFGDIITPAPVEVEYPKPVGLSCSSTPGLSERDGCRRKIRGHGRTRNG